MDRFWSKVRKSGTAGCWPFTGGVGASGYGVFWLDGRSRSAHAVAYELLVGTVPRGLQLDHLCRNRLCVNPAHLEPVTPRENVLRGATLAAANAAKTHCPSGHLYNTENTRYDRRGSRVCRACQREHQRKAHAKRKAAA